MTDTPKAMRGKHWHEMVAGERVRTADRTVTETDLVNFITQFGFNEPLFWDARHAESAGYAGRLVPGALTYCIAEGLLMQTHMIHGTGLAFMGMELSVHQPVYVGDTLHAIVETTEARPSQRGDRGVVTQKVTVRNQDDVDVLTYTPVRLIRGEPD